MLTVIIIFILTQHTTEIKLPIAYVLKQVVVYVRETCNTICQRKYNFTVVITMSVEMAKSL